MSGGGLGEAADDAYARRLEAVVAGHRGEAAVAERLLSDSAAAVRAAALGALARCGELQVAQIRRALGDEAAAVRCRAAELAPVEVELVGLLSDPDVSVVEAAAAALGERDRDPGPVEELCQVARGHDDPLCRESAVAALGAIAAGLDADADADAGPDAAQAMALEVLLAAMEDRPQIRRRALLGLHQFDDDRAADAVRAALEDRDRQVRAVAGELLGVPVH
ncbi:HEAT repeat domain-containing protein [Candidatus Poriferisodalis sp.]|uniref:HEAT repeat domain-containing protein n=1 Tax=Candidatus Poriferisodalis sp. TaxID=3101277 RepID=UPI003B5BB4C8